MRKRTIAFVINSLTSGGAERVVSILANSLVSRHNVIIITFISAPIFYDLHKEIKVEHCTHEIKPSKNPFQAVVTNFSLVKRIGFFFSENKVDVCIGFMTTANILSVIASKIQRIPIIISERNNPYLEDRTTPILWKKLRGLVYPKANYLVVQTEGIKSFYKNFIEQKRLKIIPNPINPQFKNKPEIERENVILNVGRLSEQKAQHILIEAFANIKPKGWKLYIVGSGEKKEDLDLLVRDSDMSNQIELLGTVKNVDKLYSSSKIFAFTSIYEGFPNALLEAMYFGLACISTDCPTGPSELIQNDKTGYLVPVNDVKALEDRLEFLINNEKEIERIGNAAKDSTKIYDVDSVVSKWENLISLVQ